MDIVTDFAAETVSYLVLLQDIVKCHPEIAVVQKLSASRDWKTIILQDFEGIVLTSNQQSRINDLVWFSRDTFSQAGTTKQYLTLVTQLLNWLSEENIAWDPKYPPLYQSPFFLRRQIRRILFDDAAKRSVLAEKLEYMPLQIILALSGKGQKAYDIRLFQVYMPGTNTLLNEPDLLKNESWWAQNGSAAAALLLDDEQLLEKLKEQGFPLPFETLFGDELKEITACRKARKNDIKMSGLINNDSAKEAPKTDNTGARKNNDPVKRAADMKLMGIAFSGGGIRSATFNLGIIQRLASLNLLHHFDYLSTVSGGGYIGTWLSSWIKRSASVSKVTDRLCPDRSADPLADEVRPVRWLRMFSNYLSPNVSIMSPDAWASGMTWLRNTLINQFVLLLVMLTVLSIIYDLNQGWIYFSSARLTFDGWHSFFWSLGILFPGALMASVAMRSFDPPELRTSGNKYRKYWEDIKQKRPLLKEWAVWIPNFLVIWGGVFALIISIWFYADVPHAVDLSSKIILLWPCGISTLLCFILLAFRGNYHKRRDLRNLGRSTVKPQSENAEEQRMDDKLKIITAVMIFVSSVLASVACVLLLALAWTLIQYMKMPENLFAGIDPQKLVVVAGLPLLLEVLSLTVIVRMAIMGNLFPDYRREWWGRVGGLLHRFVVVWILTSTASLILPDLYPAASKALVAAWGGWAGIVGWGVKKAFESKEDSAQDTKKFSGTVIKIVPFVFMIGFLLISAWIIGRIRELCPLAFPFAGNKDLASLLGTALLAIVTFFLSWRIGVNEFSLHHFYRNRLIRAYMGATRTREDRIKTANAFTGFDTNDDLLLSSFVSKDGYQGPYPIINTTLNATVISALDRQDRMAESFIFSPLYCGYDFSPTRSSTYNIDHVYEYGYRPTMQYANENGGPTAGTAMAISGAAVNPNWGYHSSASMAFLLTLFNVRLGWWIGNPRLEKWKNAEPRLGLVYLMQDLIGKSDISTEYVCLSDGGHFDNMGLYELVRRRCHYIILGDGEQDDNASCEGLANAIRRCRIDFGVEIEIDLTPITRKDKETRHLVKGEIRYPGADAQPGTIIYIKTSLAGDETVDIREYASANKTFPQQSTADQFFDEAQFESYRKLGFLSIKEIDDLCLPWLKPTKKQDEQTGI